jgi:hypothetical protein
MKDHILEEGRKREWLCRVVSNPKSSLYQVEDSAFVY